MSNGSHRPMVDGLRPAGLDEDATAPAVAAAVPGFNTDGRTERFIPVPGFMGQTGPAVTTRNVLIASLPGTPGRVPAGFPVTCLDG